VTLSVDRLQVAVGAEHHGAVVRRLGDGLYQDALGAGDVEATVGAFETDG
jgi:hypothetical protein